MATSAEGLSARLHPFTVTERCAYCDFSARGSLEDVRERWEAHACERPPPPKQKRRGGGFRIYSAAR